MVPYLLCWTVQPLYALVFHRLSAANGTYDDLKSKHFVLDDDSSIVMELLPLRSRRA
jgi:hypothetical protein